MLTKKASFTSAPNAGMLLIGTQKKRINFKKEERDVVIGRNMEKSIKFKSFNHFKVVSLWEQYTSEKI